MFHDLNIPWPASAQASSSSSRSNNQQRQGQSATQSKKSKGKGKADSKQDGDPGPSTPRDPLAGLSQKESEDMKAMATELIELGYSLMAYNQLIYSRFDPSLHRNPFEATASGQPRPPFPELDPRVPMDGKGKGKARVQITQLSRMTLVMDEASMSKSGTGMTNASASALSTYDLLSARPQNEAAFQHACLSLSELKPFSIDIISLDLSASPRLPFYLKRTTVSAALANGAVFEICYSAAVSDGENGDGGLKARRNLISCTRDLLRVTNGKGVIFSSGAADVMGLRGPYDVINLATVFGMNPAAARDALTTNCRALLMRAHTRQTYRGVVSHPVVRTLPLASSSSGETPSAPVMPDPDIDMVGISGNATPGARKRKETPDDHPSPVAAAPAPSAMKGEKGAKKRKLDAATAAKGGQVSNKRATLS